MFTEKIIISFKLYMKKIYILFAFVLIANTVSAQYNHLLRFGVKGGLNVASQNMAGSGVTTAELRNKKTITSFNISFYVDMPVNDDLSVQTGLGFNGKGVSFEEQKLGTLQSKKRTTINYIELPLNAIYKIDNFFIGAGPYLAHAIGAQSKTTITGSPDITETVAIGNERGVSQIRPFDAGVNLLLGYMVNNGLNFNLNYGMGLSNIYLTPDIRVKNRMLSINIGYMFGKNRNYWF